MKMMGRRRKGRRRVLGERGGPQTPPSTEEKVMENNRQVQGRARTWPWMDGIQSWLWGRALPQAQDRSAGGNKRPS